MTRFALILILTAIVVLFVAPPAMAAGPDGTVDLSPLIEAAIGVVVALLGTAGTWAVTRLAGWLKLKEDSEVRTYLDQALARALDYGKATALNLTADNDFTKLKVRNEAVELAAEYALQRVPGALKHFGVGKEALVGMLRARLQAADPAPTAKS